MPEKFYFNGVRYTVDNLTLENQINNFDTFSCRVLSISDTLRSTIGRGGHLLASHEVLINDIDGTLIFGGFLEDAKDEGSNLILTGRDYKVLLLDERTPRNLEYINQTGSTIINSILGYSSKVVAGTITFAGTISGTLSFNHDNLLRAVASVCAQGGVDFWLENDAGTIKLNVGTRGTTPGITYKAGREIAVTGQQKPTRDIINRQRVFGHGDGINQIEVCVPYLNQSIGMPDTDRRKGFDTTLGDTAHAAATTSQSTYGVMEGKPYVDRGIVSTDIAITKAKLILDDSAADYKRLDVVFLKYVEGRIPGDTVTVVDRKKNINEAMRIKKINRNMDRKIITMTFFNEYDELSDRLANVQRDSDLSNINGLGATNIFQIASYENCDNPNPLNLRFRLPDDIVLVNKVFCSFKLKDYRAYHTGLAADAAHTHTLAQKVYDESLKTGTPDIYLVGELFFNVIDGYKLGSGDSTRTLLAETSSAGTSHNHAVTYAINEVTLTSPSVVVTAGIEGAETAVGTYTTDQNEIDITSNIGATGNWMNVKFVPNKPMRIECNIYVKCYIESK